MPSIPCDLRPEPSCAKCGRTNCRVQHWESLLAKCTVLEREHVERALSAARVSCFIRTRATQARAQRDD